MRKTILFLFIAVLLCSSAYAEKPTITHMDPNGLIADPNSTPPIWHGAFYISGTNLSPESKVFFRTSNSNEEWQQAAFGGYNPGQYIFMVDNIQGYTNTNKNYDFKVVNPSNEESDVWIFMLFPPKCFEPTISNINPKEIHTDAPLETIEVKGGNFMQWMTASLKGKSGTTYAEYKNNNSFTENSNMHFSFDVSNINFATAADYEFHIEIQNPYCPSPTTFSDPIIEVVYVVDEPEPKPPEPSISSISPSAIFPGEPTKVKIIIDNIPNDTKPFPKAQDPSCLEISYAENPYTINKQLWLVMKMKSDPKCGYGPQEFKVDFGDGNPILTGEISVVMKLQKPKPMAIPKLKPFKQIPKKF